MADFVKLTDVTTPTGATEVWVNLDLVQTLRRLPPQQRGALGPARPEHTRVGFRSSGASRDSWDFVAVDETPERILNAKAPGAP
jgi:hypothetical protein